jgi:hypothetical protein
MTGRRGVTLVELIGALLITGALVAGVSRALIGASLAQQSVAARAEALVLSRMTRVLIGREVQGGVGGVDWRLTGSDALALRAYRGIGVVCGPPTALDRGLRVPVRYSGSRLPNALKDSSLVVLADGSIATVDLLDMDPAGCRGEGGLSLILDRVEPGAAPILIRPFERLEYHLSDSTLRLRRGRAGRQPLGPSVLHPASHFRALGDRGVELHLQFADPPGPVPAARSRLVVVPAVAPAWSRDTRGGVK